MYFFTPVIDAAGKPASNLMGGGIMWLGDFDECLSVKDVDANITGQHQFFSGQYCKVRIPIKGVLKNLFPVSKDIQFGSNLSGIFNEFISLYDHRLCL